MDGGKQTADVGNLVIAVPGFRAAPDDRRSPTPTSSLNLCKSVRIRCWKYIAADLRKAPQASVPDPVGSSSSSSKAQATTRSWQTAMMKESPYTLINQHRLSRGYGGRSSCGYERERPNCSRIATQSTTNLTTTRYILNAFDPTDTAFSLGCSSLFLWNQEQESSRGQTRSSKSTIETGHQDQ